MLDHDAGSVLHGKCRDGVAQIRAELLYPKSRNKGRAGRETFALPRAIHPRGLNRNCRRMALWSTLYLFMHGAGRRGRHILADLVCMENEGKPDPKPFSPCSSDQ